MRPLILSTLYFVNNVDHTTNEGTDTNYIGDTIVGAHYF